ncbi:MAG: hypothetical protein GY814_19375 [Gammaproteobacteria bacterium]|nr:hypothetical protein [Gammaproteobacteria bacterium]
MSTSLDPVIDQENLDASLDQAIVIASKLDTDVKNQILRGLPTEELVNILYQEWYIRSSIEKTALALPQTHWAEVFRAAHQGTYRWESGWIVSRVSNTGRVVAIRGEEERMLYPGDYISMVRPGLPPSPGTEIEAVYRRDSTNQQPGFWLTYSTTWAYALHPIVRLYWNTGPEGAVRLSTLVSEKLPDDVPHSLKLPVESIGYQRADTAVLYLEGNYFEQLRNKLKEIHAELKLYLHPEIPAFTKKLEPGLALAEDPLEETESFGLHRCRLIAEGLMLEKVTDWDDFTTMRNTIKRHLMGVGIDLARPYLNPGAVNDYQW